MPVAFSLRQVVALLGSRSAGWGQLGEPVAPVSSPGPGEWAGGIEGGSCSASARIPVGSVPGTARSLLWGGAIWGGLLWKHGCLPGLI